NYLESSQACFEGEVVFDDVTPATGGASSTDIEDSLEYQWQVNYNDGGFEDISGATEEFYTTTQTALGEYIYRRKVTDLCGNIEYTNSITIIREELAALEPGVITYTGNLTVCPGEAVEFNNVTPATGGLTDTETGGAVMYQWQVNFNGTGFQDIIGATEEFYTTTETTTGIY